MPRAYGRPMASTSLTPLRLIPLTFCLLGALGDTLRLPAPVGAEISVPFLTIAVYFWTVYRPDLLSPLAVLPCALIADLLAGLPLGVTPASLLICMGLILTQRRFLSAEPFLMLWGGYVAMSVMFHTLLWLFMSLFSWHIFTTVPLMARAGLGIALFPAMAAVFLLVNRRLLDRL